MRAQFGLLDLREHVIERVGQQIDFAHIGRLRPHAVVVRVRDRARGLGELRGSGWKSAPAGASPPSTPAIPTTTTTTTVISAYSRKLASIAFRSDFTNKRAELFAVQLNRPESQDVPGFEADAALLCPRRHLILRAPLPGNVANNAPDPVVQSRGDDVRIRAECREHGARIVGVVECQRRGAVARDRVAQDVEVAHDGFLERHDLVSDEHRAGEQDDDGAGEQQHLDELAANRRRNLRSCCPPPPAAETISAERNRFELMVSCAARAVSTLTRSRTRPFSVTRRIITPRCAAPSTSLTVSVLW